MCIRDSLVRVLTSTQGRVGAARRSGCGAVLDEFAALDRKRVWLATTDGDSTVPERWLSEQMRRQSAGADAWLGTVAMDLPSGHLDKTVHLWQRRYARDHRPVHGASMGVTGHAYLLAGGFPAVASGEDRALTRALNAMGFSVIHDHRTPVLTSARRDPRAPSGVGHDLVVMGTESGCG